MARKLAFQCWFPNSFLCAVLLNANRVNSMGKQTWLGVQGRSEGTVQIFKLEIYSFYYLPNYTLAWMEILVNFQTFRWKMIPELQLFSFTTLIVNKFFFDVWNNPKFSCAHCNLPRFLLTYSAWVKIQDWGQFRWLSGIPKRRWMAKRTTGDFLNPSSPLKCTTKTVRLLLVCIDDSCRNSVLQHTISWTVLQLYGSFFSVYGIYVNEIPHEIFIHRGEGGKWGPLFLIFEISLQ